MALTGHGHLYPRPAGRRTLPVLLGALAVAGALAFVSRLGIKDPLIAIAILYAAAFSICAWRWPTVALMLIFASGPLQNDVSGGGPARFSLAEINLSLAFAVMILKAVPTRGRVLMGPLGPPILLYLAICGISSFRNWQERNAIISILQMVLYLLVAVSLFASYGSSPRDFMPALYGLVGVGAFLAVSVVVGRDEGVFGIHKNGVGGSLAAAFVVALELWMAAAKDRRRQRLIGLCLLLISAGLVATLSRGAWLAAATGLLFVMAMRREFRMMVNITFLLIPVVALAWIFVPAEKQAYAVDVQVKQSGSFGDRLRNAEIAQRFINEDPFLGQGVGLRKQFDATNICLFTLAETGVLGLVAFLGIHFVLLRMVWRARFLLDPGDPAFSCLVIGGALVLGKFVHAQLDHYWSRGTVMMAWSTAGMATCAYHTALSQRKSRGVPPCA